jgi:hypothetical protein
MNKSLPATCTPRHEFIRFGDAGTFRPNLKAFPIGVSDFIACR